MPTIDRDRRGRGPAGSRPGADSRRRRRRLGLRPDRRRLRLRVQPWVRRRHIVLGRRHRAGHGRPVGKFAEIAVSPIWYEYIVGQRVGCGLTLSGSIQCWGTGAARVTASLRQLSPGPYLHISIGDENLCVIRVDHSLACTNVADGVQLPSGAFKQISVGPMGFACAVSMAGQVDCFLLSGQLPGDPQNPPELSPPSGSYTQVAVGGVFYETAADALFACGLRVTGSVVCWGSAGSGVLNAPSGAFSHVAVGPYSACAVSTGATITCWGPGQATFVNGVPAISRLFWERALGSTAALGTLRLRASGAVVCRGDNSHAQLLVPQGRFTEVAAGPGNASCALRTDGSTACWYSSFLPAKTKSGVPIVYRHVAMGSEAQPGHSKPFACRPHVDGSRHLCGAVKREQSAAGNL